MNDVFFIVGVILLIIAKIISIMHDGTVIARALESSFAGYCRICTGLRGGFPRILDANCARMLQLTVFGR